MDDLEEYRVRRGVRLERYAKILAHVLHFGTDRTAEVVARFGLTVEHWRAVDEAWIHELALGRQRGQRAQGLDFSATLALSRDRLARESPRLEAVSDLEVAIEAAIVKETQAQEVRAAAVPSFLRGDLVTSAPPAAPPPPLAPPRPPPAVIRPGTMSMAAMPDVAEALPFAENVSPTVALQSAVEHAEAVQGAKLAKPPPLGSTVPAPDGDRIAALARQFMPFGGGAAAAPAAPTHSEPARDEPPAAGVEDLPALTLEQHASLHVELSLHPDQRPQILHRYGLTAEQHSHVEPAWQAKIAQDPKLRAAWDHASSQYRAWLLQTAAR